MNSNPSTPVPLKKKKKDNRYDSPLWITMWGSFTPPFKIHNLVNDNFAQIKLLSFSKEYSRD
jgi:hypothetical protein